MNGCSPSERNGIRSLSPLGGDQGWNLAGLFSQENNTVDTPDLDRLTLLDRAQLLPCPSGHCCEVCLDAPALAFEAAPEGGVAYLGAADKPIVSLDVISLVASSCGYYRVHIEHRAAQ